MVDMGSKVVGDISDFWGEHCKESAQSAKNSALSHTKIPTCITCLTTYTHAL